MSERDALLKAICANPDEDTPRLVFADWLDKHGDETDRVRAAYIRGAVRAATLPRCPKLPAGDTGAVATGYRCRCEVCRTNRPLERVERTYQPVWVRGVREVIARRGTGTRHPWEWAAWFERGFVGGLKMYADLFVACAAEVFALAPVRFVSLLWSAPAEAAGARTPFELRGQFVWERGGAGQPHMLPAVLFDRLPGRLVMPHLERRVKVYRDRALATAALAEGTLALGRAERDRLWHRTMPAQR